VNPDCFTGVQDLGAIDVERGRDLYNSDAMPETPLQTAAVLVPVFRDAAGELRVVLVARSDHGIHGGQLGFPGGKPEPGDAGLLETALREAKEEIGLQPDTVAVLAALRVTETRATGFRVHPFLGRIPAGTPWRLHDREIVGVLTPAARALAHAETRDLHPFLTPTWSEPRLVDGIPLDEHLLWGLTLRVLDDLLPRLLAGEWEV
jgi:8-oxo-dGTP pyrophosphatase MutT (NUDIX family)